MATATATDKVTNYYGERHDIYIGADSTDPVAGLFDGVHGRDWADLRH